MQTIDGQYKIVDTSLTTSSNNEEANRPTEPAWSSANRGCAAPEVLVNGSPSDTIDGTVSGGDMTSIEEIVFVSEISGSRHSMDTESAQETTKRNSHKRICKIKCLDGLWVGPLCAFQNDTSLRVIMAVKCAVPSVNVPPGRLDSTLLFYAKSARKGDVNDDSRWQPWFTISCIANQSYFAA
ncbi:hypothetical protein BLOT_008241 [Blomia tropicalis]|nr:hypothetical protein BLOT_008241 [Blomia tropicalis]